MIDPTHRGSYCCVGDYIAVRDSDSAQAAVSHITAHADGSLTLRPVARMAADQAHDAVRALAETTRRGPCPCACNQGGFCGGCGHAGCGARG